MTRNDIATEYFLWLCDLVSERECSPRISYQKLLRFLHDTNFEYLIAKDQNRAEDGLALRYRFACDTIGDQNVERYLDGPCSVLEMMIALAIRCEEGIMDDPHFGNRTRQWFWGMVVNLGLGRMTDVRFDKRLAECVITRFLNREYEPNGNGGLFTIRNCTDDLRSVEIWHQLCWYLDSIS